MSRYFDMLLVWEDGRRRGYKTERMLAVGEVVPLGSGKCISSMTQQELRKVRVVFDERGKISSHVSESDDADSSGTDRIRQTLGLAHEPLWTLGSSGEAWVPSTEADASGSGAGREGEDILLAFLEWDPAVAGLPAPVHFAAGRFITAPGCYLLVDEPRGIRVLEREGKLSISVRCSRESGRSSWTTPGVDPKGNWFVYVESRDRIWVYWAKGKLSLNRFEPDGRIAETCSCHCWSELRPQIPRAVRERLPQELRNEAE